MPEQTVPDRLRLYGRRQGRPLRAGQRALLHEALPSLSISLPGEGVSLDPVSLFAGPKKDIWVEIGFGGGEHLAAQAAAHPDIGFIGAEFFLNGIAQCLARLEAASVGNVRLLPGDARPLLDRLRPASLGRVFLLFPDPWPKARHAGRRFVSPQNLDHLARILRPGGELRIASDDAGYVDWTLRHLLDRPDFVWTARRASDWRIRPDDWPETRYEAKARAAGRQPVFMTFIRQ